MSSNLAKSLKKTCKISLIIRKIYQCFHCGVIKLCWCIIAFLSIDITSICIKIGWKIRKLKILEFDFRWPLSVEFNSVTVTDKGNPLTFYQKLWPYKLKEKNLSKLDEKWKFYMPSKYIKCWNSGTLCK